MNLGRVADHCPGRDWNIRAYPDAFKEGIVDELFDVAVRAIGGPPLSHDRVDDG